MYMMADTAEKCFHNALILIESVRQLGLDYDINPLDITDPNPISMILFCTFLYEKLPSYISSATLEFNSSFPVQTGNLVNQLVASCSKSVS